MSDGARGTLQAGIRFQNRYRIVRALKAGSMGAVYEVLDERTNGPRALKVMLRSLVENADQRARFAQEATLTGSLDTEHVIRVFDAGIDSDEPFLVMELLRGEDLEQVLARRGRLPEDEVILLLTQVARGLEKTHAANIVHRDLKPENLFLSLREDGSPCIKILDFGIAKVATADTAKKTRALGTPLYMSPEQLHGLGTISPAADLLSFAHVAYTLLVGEAYFADEASQNDSLLTLLKIILAGPTEPASSRALRRRQVTLPASFDAWFGRATAVVPTQRFGSAREEIDALKSLFDQWRAHRSDAATQLPSQPAPQTPVTRVAFDAASPERASTFNPVAPTHIANSAAASPTYRGGDGVLIPPTRPAGTGGSQQPAPDTQLDQWGRPTGPSGASAGMSPTAVSLKGSGSADASAPVSAPLQHAPPIAMRPGMGANNSGEVFPPTMQSPGVQPAGMQQAAGSATPAVVPSLEWQASPAALGAAPAPSKSSTALVAAILGGLVVLLGAVCLLLVLRGGDSSKKKSSDDDSDTSRRSHSTSEVVPDSQCPGIKCVKLDVDGTTMDPGIFFDRAIKLAKEVDPSVHLVALYVQEVSDGVVDLSQKKMVTSQFQSATRHLSIYYLNKQAVVMETAVTTAEEAPVPTCGFRAAWDKAVAGGMPTKQIAVTYGPGIDGISWNFSTPSYLTAVDPKTCALKRLGK